MSHSPKIITDKEIKEARVRLWNLGILEWKLGPTQKKLYDFYHGKKDKTITINCSRRLGKSYLLTIIAIEQCLKQPRSIVKFLQPEVKMIRTNIRPVMQQILDDCPKELRPIFKTQDNIWTFPNGSEIHLAGTDNGNYEKLRGGDSHLSLIDEAGFCNDLRHIVESILIPTTTLTRGKIILSSTTPPNPDHEFVKIYLEAAEISGTVMKKTIYDAYHDDKVMDKPRITEEIIAEIIASYVASGGALSDAFRTEYLCEVIHDSKDSVVPEFNKEVQDDTIVKWSPPPFHDRYVSMDIGFTDLTVVLFGYWDFDNAVLVIEAEYVVNGNDMTTKNLAQNVHKIEEKLWTHHLTGELQTPYLRVSDNNLIVINDLQRDYGLVFLPVDKQNKAAYLSEMRIMIQNRQIIIHPDCKTLISHLKSATWDKTKKEYKRSPDMGHYDAVDALVYMVRNVNKTKNPYPVGYRYSQMRKGGKDIFINPFHKEKTSVSEIEKIFKPVQHSKKKSNINKS